MVVLVVQVKDAPAQVMFSVHVLALLYLCSCFSVEAHSDGNDITILGGLSNSGTYFTISLQSFKTDVLLRVCCQGTCGSYSTYISIFYTDIT